MTTIARNRNRGTAAPVVTKSQLQDGEVSLGPIELLGSGDVESISDFVTGNYTQRIAAGDIINNPCTYSRDRRVAGGGNYVATSQSEPVVSYSRIGEGSNTEFQWFHYTGVSTFSPTDVTYDKQALIDEAKAYALSEIDSTPYAFLEDTLELRETLRFIREPFKGLRDLSKKFRKNWVAESKRSGRHDNYSKLSSDAWLEFRFAASPLLRTTMDAFEAYDATLKKPAERKTARGFQTGETHLEESFDYQWGGGTYDRNVKRLDANFLVRSGILYTVDNPIQDLNFKLGLRAKDIPQGLWAILPYSFMVDRVTDIQRAIRGVSNLLDPNVHIKAAWVVTKETVNENHSFLDQINSGVNITVTPDLVENETFVYQRVVWTPSVLDAFVHPKMDGLVSDATKILDLTALVLSNLR